MAIVTNQAEFINAITNLDPDIIVANDIALTNITNLTYTLTISSQTGATLIWNGVGVLNRTMLAVSATGALTIDSLTLDGDGRDVTLVRVNAGSFTMNAGATLRNTSGISAQNAVNVNSNGSFVMNNGLITAIDSTDAVFSSGSTVTMNDNAAISDNTSAGITLTQQSTLTMTGTSHVSNNVGKQTGGAGLIIGSNVFMGLNPGDAPYVSGNSSAFTTGAWYFSNGSSLTMRFNSEISSNFAEGFAGGIRVQQSVVAMSDNAAIKNNRSNNVGGGLYMTTGSSAILNDLAQVSGNTAAGNGGGFFAQNGALITINGNASVQNNSSENGGGIYLSAGTAFIGLDGLAPHINNNNASMNGGGIYVSASSSLEIGGATSIQNNQAPNGDGGGIYTEDTTTYANIITGSGTVFQGNRAINAFTPPPNASILYPNIQFASTSVANHPLNNFDINFTNGPILTFQVEYTANGGTGSFIEQGGTFGSLAIVLTPEVTGISRPGFVFTGWNTQPNGSGTAYAPGELITLDSNVTLYAQWAPLQLFSVTYNANGGTGSHVDANLASGTLYTVLSPEQAGISREGYTFTGWNTQPNGMGVAYAPGASIPITGNVILYAQWRMNEPVQPPHIVHRKRRICIPCCCSSKVCCFWINRRF